MRLWIIWTQTVIKDRFCRTEQDTEKNESQASKHCNSIAIFRILERQSDYLKQQNQAFWMDWSFLRIFKSTSNEINMFNSKMYVELKVEYYISNYWIKSDWRRMKNHWVPIFVCTNEVIMCMLFVIYIKFLKLLNVCIIW